MFSILFADDTNVFLEGTHFEGLIETLNEELQKVNIWLKANKLTLNLAKTHFMLYHRTRIKNRNFQLNMDGHILSEASSTKFLGIIIDNKLNWTEHINYIKSKISKALGILLKTRNFLNKSTLRNLYYTFVYPYLIYGVEIWGNAREVHLDPLIKTQKKIVRVITFSSYLEHTAPLFEYLNILSFKKLVIHRIGLLMFKYNSSELPNPINKLFTHNNERHNYNTRHNNDLLTKIGNGEQIYQLFSFHGVKVWNHIHSKLVINVSYSIFKNCLKTYVQFNDIPYRLI